MVNVNLRGGVCVTESDDDDDAVQEPVPKKPKTNAQLTGTVSTLPVMNATQHCLHATNTDVVTQLLLSSAWAVGRRHV